MTTITRRTLLGTVTLPAALAPLGLAKAATTPATDATWAELETAREAAERLSRAADAFRDAKEARLPERLKERNRPTIHDFDRYEDFRPVVDAWNAEREAYGVNPYDGDGGPLERAYDRVGRAELAVVHTPATTAADVERKLSVMADLADANMVEREWLEGLLADVRRINGEAA